MRLLILLATTLLSYSISAQSINSQNSKVNFSVKNMKVNTVEGTFMGMQGDVKFDEENMDLCSFDVCVDAASVDTGIKKRDSHLREPDFFNVAEYPKICFTSTSTTKLDKGYEVTGTLLMNGVEKEVIIPFLYNDSKFTGLLSLKRKDYNLGLENGFFMIGEFVNIQILCELDSGS